MLFHMNILVGHYDDNWLEKEHNHKYEIIILFVTTSEITVNKELKLLLSRSLCCPVSVHVM